MIVWSHAAANIIQVFDRIHESHAISPKPSPVTPQSMPETPETIHPTPVQSLPTNPLKQPSTSTQTFFQRPKPAQRVETPSRALPRPLNHLHTHTPELLSRARHSSFTQTTYLPSAHTLELRSRPAPRPRPSPQYYTDKANTDRPKAVRAHCSSPEYRLYAARPQTRVGTVFAPLPPCVARRW